MPTINANTLYAQAAALATAIAGQVVALVPSWMPFEKGAISLGSFALAVAIIIAHAIRNQPVTPPAATGVTVTPTATQPELAAAVDQAVRARFAELGAAVPTTTTAGTP